MFKKQFFYDSHEPPFLRGISEDCGSLNKYSPTLLLITGPYPLLIVSLPLILSRHPPIKVLVAYPVV